MKVAFIYLHPFSDSLGSIVRVRELATSLHKFGVDSYILTPYEDDHVMSTGVNVVSIGGAMRRLGLDGYLYKFAKYAYYNKFFANHFMTNRTLQRRLALGLASSIANTLDKLDIDIVQVEQDMALSAGVEVKKRTNLPLLVDLHNITAEELIATGTIARESSEFEALQKLSREKLQQVDSIAVVSDEMKKYVSTQYGISSGKISVVPPGGDPSLAKLVERKFPPRVVYAGLVSFREHVDLFVKSMPIINEKSDSVQFYVTKKGEGMAKLRRLATELGVNPLYFWYSDVEEFHRFLSSCHVAVLPSSDDLARRMGTPVKLFDYLSVGLPVVANDVGTWTKLIEKERLGIVTEDDPADFAAGILELIENRDLADKCRNNGLELVSRHFNWDNSAKILFDNYVRILGNRADLN